MYRSLRIENFRGIADLELEDFGAINLITGLNDAGKTTILEALFLHSSGPLAAANTLRTLRPGRRQTDIAVNSAIQDPWQDLFRNRIRDSPILFHSREKDGTQYTVTMEADDESDSLVDIQPASGSDTNLKRAIRVNVAGTGKRAFPETDYTSTLSATAPPTTGGVVVVPSVNLSINPQPKGPHINAFYVRESVAVDLADGYSQLRLKGAAFDVLSAVKEIDPRIESLEVITENGRSTLWVTIDGEFLPSNLLGDGPITLLTYVITAAQARNGILLIDELGSGIHHSVLARVWRTLYRATRSFKVQIFATTHSDEVIGGAADVVKDHANDLALFRLMRPDKGGIPRVSRYSQHLVGAALDIETELR